MTDEPKLRGGHNQSADRAFEALIAPARDARLATPERAALKARILAQINGAAAAQYHEPGTDDVGSVVAFRPPRQKQAVASSPPETPRTSVRYGPAAALVAASLVLGVAVGATSLGDGVARSIVGSTQPALALAEADGGQMASLFDGLMVDGAEDVF